MEITQPLHRALQLTPDRTITVFGGRSRTVAESADRIARLAGALHVRGLQPGDPVGIVALNSDIFHEALLGIPWAGGVVAPVNYRWSAAEIAYSLEECGVSVLIVDDAFLDLAAAVLAVYEGVTTLIHTGTAPAPNQLTKATPFWMTKTYYVSYCRCGTATSACACRSARSA